MTSPKLYALHLQQRIREHLEKLQRGQEVEARKDKTLLNLQQQQSLKDALEAQKALKRQHNRPKTDLEKRAIGWKEIRQVRLEIYTQALAQLQDNLVEDIHKMQGSREIKAAKVFMEAWSKAGKEGKGSLSAISEGNIALTRAGFKPKGHRVLSIRDKEIHQLEAVLMAQYENRLSDEEREDLKMKQEIEAASKK